MRFGRFQHCHRVQEQPASDTALWTQQQVTDCRVLAEARADLTGSAGMSSAARHMQHHVVAQKIPMAKAPAWDDVHAGRFGTGDMPDSQPNHHADSHAISA